MNNQFEYFLKNLLLCYDIEKSSIDYGNDGEGGISIIKNVETDFWSERKALDGSQIIWKKWKSINIPFLFENDPAKDIITYENGKARINYDIVASSFYLLSGWDEITSAEKDGLGRIKYHGSLVQKLGISALPVVNYYFDILKEALEAVGKNKLRLNLWGENKFAVLLSHDIDSCKRGWYKSAVSELRKKRFMSIPGLIFRRLFMKDEWFNFDEISQIEERFNARSSFYFLPQQGKAGEWENADYNITSNSIQGVMSGLEATGNEVGVHGSFGTHTSAERLRTDLQRINQEKVFGNRFHFLMFDPIRTVSVMAECDIKYDTSLCFAEKIGFRRATCFPFYLYDFKNNRPSEVMEIPLIVMDTTLADHKYMDMKPSDVLPAISGLIDEVEKFGGVFTLLWHNTFFSEYKYPGWKEVYLKILKHLHSRKAFLSHGRAIYKKIKLRESD